MCGLGGRGGEGGEVQAELALDEDEGGGGAPLGGREGGVGQAGERGARAFL